MGLVERVLSEELIPIHSRLRRIGTAIQKSGIVLGQNGYGDNDDDDDDDDDVNNQCNVRNKRS